MNAHDMVAALSVPDGGFSVDVVTGQAASKGYAVSTHPQCERRLEWPVTAEDLLAYANDHASELRLPCRLFGGWRDPSSGGVFLDVSTVVGTEDDAHFLACRYGQRAYFDFATGRSVSVSNVPA